MVDQENKIQICVIHKKSNLNLKTHIKLDIKIYRERYYANGNQNNTGVAILILDKANL
jgi:hypothetical protein